MSEEEVWLFSKMPFHYLQRMMNIFQAILAVASAQVASAQASPLPAAPVEASRPIIIGQSYRIESKILGDHRVINVQLPEDYGDKERRFPVLFLLDGGEHEDFLHIAGLAQINAAYGQGQEMIVVGIEGVDRRHDLTPPSNVAGDLKAAPTSGGAEQYRQFLVRELKPWVQSRFRTNGKTAVMGESLAGLFVLQTFIEQPDDFSDYIAISPSLWWKNGYLAANVKRMLSERSYEGKRIWIAFEVPPPPPEAAAKDRARQLMVIEGFRRVKPRGLAWTIVHSGNGHTSIYHPAALEAFRALYGLPGQ